MNCVIGNCALRSLSLSYPKKSPSLGMTQTIKLYSAAFTDYVMQSVSYQMKDWQVTAHRSFFGYDNNKDLKAPLPMTQLQYYLLSMS